MVKRLSLLLAALGMLLPVAVSALGLGEIRLSSALNEPLRAEIPLISIDPEEIDVLSVKLASRAQYEQAGIEQVPELRQLRFEPTTAADGSPVIRVTTRDSVAEPFLNFLIEVNWPTGRVVREYTLLLDPPTLMRGAPPVSQLPAVSEPAAARPPSVSAPSIAPPSGGEYGPVLQGETLWQIAETVRPDPSLTVQQVMLALQQANPEAFLRSNINLLRAGVVLRVPSRDEMAALAADEARSSARAQAAEWEAYRGQVAERVTAAPRTETPAPAAEAAPEAEAPARLELVVPEKQPESAQSAAPEGAGAPAGVGEVTELRRQLDLATEEAEARRLQNEELNSQIRDLEEQVAALEKLIELNVDEMAALQQNLEAQQAASDAAPAEGEMAAAPTEGQPLEQAPAEGEPSAEPVATEAAPAEGEMAPAGSEAAAMAEPAEEKPAEGEHGHAAGAEAEAAHGHAEEAKPAAAPPPPPPPAPEPGLFEDPILLGGAAVILLALIGVVVAKRRGRGKAEEAVEDEQGEPAQLFDAAEDAVEEQADEAAAGGGLLGRLKGLFTRKAKDEEVFEEAEEEAEFEGEPATAPVAEAATMSEPAAQEPSFEAGEATGRDVLNEFAPEGVGGEEEGEDPLERADVFLAYGRTDQAEEVLRGLLSREPGRVDVMVKLLEIYSGNQDRASFERQLEDLHETLAGEGGAHWDRAIELARGIAPDHRLLATAATAAAATAAGVAAEAVEPAVEEEEISLDQLDTDELDLDFDFEPVYGDEEEADGGEPLDITQEFTGGELGDLADEGAVDAALSGDAEAGVGETEVDLGIDLAGGDLEASSDDEGLGGALDFDAGDATPDATAESDEALEGFSLDVDETPEAPAETASGDADATDFDLDLDMGDLDAPAEAAAGPADAPEEPAAAAPVDLEETLAGGDLADLGDLGDLGDLDATLSGDEGGFDAGADMIETKLELASTYLDMDDFEGAKGILDEVVAEGSDAQKAKAQELLGRIPG